MMTDLRRYVFSLICAAILCCIASEITKNGKAKDAIHMFCGILVTITMLEPLSNLDLNTFLDASLPYLNEAHDVVLIGEEMASRSVKDIIKQETEAYILDKASELDAGISVEITVNDDYIPVNAVLYGQISSSACHKLSNILETDLGITKENQIWTG